MRKFLTFVFGAVAGGLLGAALAMLLAPASGKQVRSQITDYTQQVRQEILLAAQQKRDELEDELNRLRAPHPPAAPQE